MFSFCSPSPRTQATGVTGPFGGAGWTVLRLITRGCQGLIIPGQGHIRQLKEFTSQKSISETQSNNTVKLNQLVCQN